jgi:putative tricarboxylic transport membrane protein
VINLPFAPLWAKLLMIPKPYLYAGITVFSALGVYASSGSIFDVAMLTLIGLLGFALRRFGLPLAPVLIAVILGPLAETSSVTTIRETRPLTTCSPSLTAQATTAGMSTQ